MKPPRLKADLLPSILTFVAAGIWGLYWLPLRTIEAAGITGLWSIFIVYAIPLIFLSPLAVLRRKQIRTHFWPLLLVGITIGGGLTCYATGFLYTTIMRTTLLFYLTPVWSTLLGMLLLQEKVTKRRWIAIAIGLLGLGLMLSHNGDSLQLTALNPGDIAALMGGILWGAGTVLIRRTPQLETPEMLPVQYLCATLIALLLIAVTGQFDNAPDTSQWSEALPVVFIYYVLIMLPAMTACIWAATLLSPGRVGILMMSEVLIAGISAPLLAGEILSARDWLPAALILLAGVLEVTSPASNNVVAQKTADQI